MVGLATASAALLALLMMHGAAAEEPSCGVDGGDGSCRPGGDKPHALKDTAAAAKEDASLLQIPKEGGGMGAAVADKDPKAALSQQAVGLGSFSQLKASVEPCRLSGVWHSAGNHSVAFRVDDMSLMLHLSDAPEMSIEWVKTEGGGMKADQILVGGEEQDLERLSHSRLSEVVQAPAVVHLKSLSDMLGNQGKSGDIAPSGCFYRFHHALLGLVKLRSRGFGQMQDMSVDESEGDPKTCPESPPLAQPGDGQDTRRTSAASYQTGFSGGAFADNYGYPYTCSSTADHSKTVGGVGLSTVHCKQRLCEKPGYPCAVQACQGMCGALCECWIGICGTEYHCQYNKHCCQHDYDCANALSAECLAYKHVGVGVYCNQQTVRATSSGQTLRGPLKQGEGCSDWAGLSGWSSWCQSGSCTRWWDWAHFGKWTCN